MSNMPQPKVLAAMELIKSGMSPYAAARQVGIALSTIYRSKLYLAHKSGCPSAA